MGSRDSSYKLSGVLELDDAFFTTELPAENKDFPLKRGLAEVSERARFSLWQRVFQSKTK